MPHRPDGVLYLPILHNTFVPILKGEGGKRGSEGRELDSLNQKLLSCCLVGCLDLASP